MATARDEEIFKLRSALSLARLHYEQGLYDRAEPVYRRALLFFDQGDELRHCLQCLSVLYSVWNHYSDALEMYVRLLALNENEYGKTDRRTIAVMREMASIYVQMGQPQKADKIHQRATIRERERERPAGPAYEADDNGRSSSSSGISQYEPPEPVQTETQDKVQKLVTKLRPLISGFQVDFTDNRTQMLAKFIIAVILLFGLVTAAMVMPRNPQPIDVYRAIPHEYKTADGKATFNLNSDSECTFKVGEETFSLPYHQFLSDWRDVVAMIYGSIYEKQYQISRKEDGAVLDGDGRTFYGANTPEAKTIEEIAVIRKAVESFFIVKQRYPKKITERIVFPYTNPVTNLQELPNHQILTIGDRKWTTATSLKERTNFYKSLLNGAPWPQEPALRPGSINSCSVVMISEAGEFYDFLLHGSDRNGKTLLTSEPGKSYVISLQNAKELEAPTPPIPFAGKMLVRPRRAWLMRPGINDLELHLLHHGLAYFYAFLAVLSLAFYVHRKYFSDDATKAGKYMLYTLACAVLCIIYEISLACP